LHCVRLTVSIIDPHGLSARAPRLLRARASSSISAAIRRSTCLPDPRFSGLAAGAFRRRRLRVMAVGRGQREQSAAASASAVASNRLTGVHLEIRLELALELWPPREVRLREARIRGCGDLADVSLRTLEDREPLAVGDRLGARDRPSLYLHRTDR
jgi:hypothetical protein